MSIWERAHGKTTGMGGTSKSLEDDRKKRSILTPNQREATLDADGVKVDQQKLS